MFAQESVMDIKKEREAFESVFTETRGWDLTFIMGCYQNIETLRAFAGWQAAKAQAVPEGFVLVPREMPKSFDEGLYVYSNSISIVDECSDGFIPMSDINHAEVWKLVIEAQEQAND